jgi:hypothetical protein
MLATREKRTGHPTSGGEQVDRSFFSIRNFASPAHTFCALDEDAMLTKPMWVVFELFKELSL